ncbi:PsbP domain-containing protein 5- chloroplastic [Striga hermonthica]|uniref:PsbP domain-containing protein 5- chloroplastic n=1 Tax=Striga hermonthica TaxID=68872 RepID=A0A9N7MMI9_STRHE|nr:PsbP domain-containing protein 5- chloroplastic [Striga hermonthica]
MATALPSIRYHRSLIPNLAVFRNNALKLSVTSHKKPKMCCSMRKTTAGLTDSSQIGVLRRDLMLAGFSSSFSLIFPISGSSVEEELKMDIFVDDINAYSYMYPKELPSDKFVFKWVESRKPERYSSAAPLSPDARLRIVSERVDFIDNLIISVSIGPPNSLVLKSKDTSTWSAKDVADSVLADKSALRVTSSQRMDESSVLDAHSSIVDGEPYWYYEYLVRKSPTKNAQESNLYRHFVASTATRDGYLYTLSASTLSKQWDKMGPVLEKSVASFRLLPPTENYVPPYKDPWRFW